ncbi:MAG: serine hydrolase domain-containing protein [Hyphomonadaceae bacterium]
MTNVPNLLAKAVAEVLPVNLVAGDTTTWPIADRMAKYHVPGVSVCVIDKGEVAEAGGYGLTEAGGRPVGTDTVFAGASISKPLTAVLALQLVDEGRIDLDGPVNRHLTQWRIPENDFTRQKPVTLRHLLSHRAGTTVHGFGNFPMDRPAPTLLEILNGQPPASQPAVVVDKLPGGSVRYSGGGTQVVQLLLEETTGLDFATLAEERLFKPLGMSRTTFRHPLPPAIRAASAIGHDKTGAPIASRLTFTPELAAGGVYTTAPDYARFMVACRNAWLGKKNALLSPGLAKQMMQRQENGQFGLGWEIFGEGAKTRFAHGGSNEGYQCNTLCMLEQGSGAVVLTNALLGILLYTEVINGVARAYGWQNYFKPPKTIIPVSPERQAALVGRYDIVSGISAPHLDMWVENGQLHSFIEGLILPPRPIYLADNGRFFTQQTASETEIEWDREGRPVGLTVYAEGDTPLLQAVRRA